MTVFKNTNKMRLKITNIKSIYLLIILFQLSVSIAFTQESDTVRTAHPRLYIGINGGPSISKEINSKERSVSGLTSVDKNTFSGSFELGYFFSKSFGLSTGIEYFSYSSELSLTSYNNKFTTTDSENESYERRITGSNIKEIQNIIFLKIPLCLNIQFSLGKRFGMYIQTGANMVLPLSKDYSGSGTFSYVGYYPAFNVTFQNLPEYGFPDNATVSTKGQLKLKSTNFEVLTGAGVQCFVSKKLQVILGVTYARSLSTISGYTVPEEFQLSTNIDNLNSLMGGTSNVTLQSIGLKLGIRYYLR